MPLSELFSLSYYGKVLTLGSVVFLDLVAYNTLVVLAAQFGKEALAAHSILVTHYNNMASFCFALQTAVAG